MSAEHTDQIAPRLAQARKATAVCGTLGMKAATRSPGPTPMRVERSRERADLAAQLRPGDLLRAAFELHRLVAKDDRRVTGGMRRVGMAKDLRGVVDLRRRGTRRAPGIFSSARTQACGVAEAIAK